MRGSEASGGEVADGGGLIFGRDGGDLGGGPLAMWRVRKGWGEADLHMQEVVFSEVHLCAFARQHRVSAGV
jgi:hypothetical protein